MSNTKKHIKPYVFYRFGNAGQALLELAIFGMIGLMALGYLIRTGLRLNYNQEARMAAFRLAERLAFADNNSNADARGTPAFYENDRAVPDPTDSFMTMPHERTGAGGFVEWGSRLTYSSYTAQPTFPRIAVSSNGAVGAVNVQAPTISPPAIATTSTVTNTSNHGLIEQDQDDTSLSSTTVTSASVSGPYTGAGSSMPSGFNVP